MRTDTSLTFSYPRSPLHGYSGSQEYLLNVLRTQVACDVTTQTFPSLQSNELARPQLTVLSEPPQPLQWGVDFVGMRYGGNGDFSFAAPVAAVANYGCAAGDYNLTAGSVALVLVAPSGDCDLVRKSMLFL